MSCRYQILADRGIVYVHYAGRIDFGETAEAFAAYARDPGFRTGQKHLVDLSDATEIDSDYALLLAVQARKAETFVYPGGETLIVYYAPTPETDRIARFVLHSWEGVPGVIVGVVNDEGAALAFLGQSEDSFAEIFERAIP